MSESANPNASMESETVPIDPMLEALIEAVDIAGGQARLAKALGVRQQNVWSWIHRVKKAPAEFVLHIEGAVQYQVSRHRLRPDVFGATPEAGRPKAAA